MQSSPTTQAIETKSNPFCMVEVGWFGCTHRVDSVTATKLDLKYTLVKTVWSMRVQANNGDEVASKTSATYILSTVGDSFEIVFQVDHQDLTKTVQDLRGNSVQS